MPRAIATAEVVCLPECDPPFLFTNTDSRLMMPAPSVPSWDPCESAGRLMFAGVLNMRNILLIILLLSPAFVRAERLPLKAYTVADGLPNNIINKIVRDSRGFLWCCTSEGLSRFDGYSFTNYGVDQGLPHSTVNDFLETRNGSLWIATNGGLVLFNPRGE